MTVRCKCGRYAKYISHMENMLDQIKDVKINCSRCGIHITNNWTYEDFYPDPNEY